MISDETANGGCPIITSFMFSSKADSFIQLTAPADKWYPTSKELPYFSVIQSNMVFDSFLNSPRVYMYGWEGHLTQFMGFNTPYNTQTPHANQVTVSEHYISIIENQVGNYGRGDLLFVDLKLANDIKTLLFPNVVYTKSNLLELSFMTEDDDVAVADYPYATTNQKIIHF